MGNRASTVALSAALALASALVAALPAVAGIERWTTSGPPGGTIRALEIHPGNADIMLAASGTGGIFRTSDGGASWRRTSGLPRDSQAFAVAFAPSNPTIVYAGTHRAGGQRSEDGGLTWRQIYAETTVRDIEPDPFDSEVVFLVTGTETLRSEDGGQHWTELTFPGGKQALDVIEAAPSRPGRFYLAGVAAIHRTDDWGGTWSMNHGSPTFQDLVVDPANPDRVFGITRSEGVFRSTDAGQTWQPLSEGLPRDDRDRPLPVTAIEMHPTNPNVLYVGADRRGRLFRTRDGGLTWKAVPTRLSDHGVGEIAIDPTSGRRLIAGFVHDGLAVSADGGRSWARSDAGLIGSDVKSLLLIPGSNLTVLAGTWGQGVFRSTDGGASWQRSGLPSQTVMGLASHASSPQTIYAAASKGLFRSGDGGLTWRRMTGLAAGHLVDVAVSAVDPRLIYATQFEYAYGSRDGGSTWRQIRHGTFMSLAVHPARAGTVYLGARGALLRSTDAGETWSNLHDEFFWHADAQAVAVDPHRPRIVLAAMDPGGLLRSRDGGETWRGTARGHLDLINRAQAVVFDPAHPGRVYAAGFDVLPGGVVLRSDDHGATWSRVSRSGLTTSWMSSLAVSSDGRRLYAGTTGYGLNDGGGAFAWRYR